MLNRRMYCCTQYVRVQMKISTIQHSRSDLLLCCTLERLDPIPAPCRKTSWEATRRGGGSTVLYGITVHVQSRRPTMLSLVGTGPVYFRHPMALSMRTRAFWISARSYIYRNLANPQPTDTDLVFLTETFFSRIHQ